MYDETPQDDYVPEHYLQAVNEGDTQYFHLEDSNFTALDRPSFTIFVAPPGSKFIDMNAENVADGEGNSRFGHVFMGIKGYNSGTRRFEAVSIGFGTGDSILTNEDNVSFNDHLRYPEASSLTITGMGTKFNEDMGNLFYLYNQYKKGDIELDNYNLYSNNCIDFINDFLKDAEIEGVEVSGSPKSLLKALKNLAKKYKTPIIFDLNKDGVKTLPDSFGVKFEFDGVNEKTAWVDPNDGLLVFDRDSNGIIDNASELFGDNFMKRDGNKAVNGFDALLDIDSNDDGLINRNDILWYELRIWQDKNSDGKSQYDELLTLEGLGVESIDLKYQESLDIDEYGNKHQLKSKTQWKDGSFTDVTDVWLMQSNEIQLTNSTDNINSQLIEKMASMVSDHMVGIPEYIDVNILTIPNVSTSIKEITY